MSEFVAGAFVDVRPDTKGFRDALKKQVDSSLKNFKVTVPIQFEVKAFKKQLQDAARAAKPRIPIEIGGNVATLRRDLNRKIASATEGLKVKVPVEFQAAGAGSRGGAAGGVPGGTGGTGRGGGTGGAAGSRKALTDEEKLAISVTKALDTAEAKSIATQKSLASAIDQRLSTEERAARLGEARTTANAAVRTTTDALARAEGLLTTAQRTQLENANKAALAQRALVIEKQKALKLDTLTATTTDKVTESRAATTAALAVEVTEIGSLNELHVLENELLAAEAALKRSTNAARKLGLTDLVQENELLAANIAERKILIQTQRDELKGEGKRQRQQKTGLRGGAATILQLFGLRGATLAATGSFLAGTVAVTTLTKSLKAFADFETELNTFKAVAGATNEQMQEVSKTAEELGADITLPAVSAADAAIAMTELARAGLDVRNSLAGARGVLELAAAAQISNADAATLVASGLNAFGLAGEEAVHVADLLANAANAAQGSISEMGAALQQAAAIAHQVGVNLDDTVGLLTLLAKNGLRGSDAGTSLRTSFARLIAPTKKAADLLDELNVNVRDLNGNVRPEFFAEFAQATRNLTPALRDMIAETVAGQDSIRAFSILGSEGARGLKLARLEMAQQGTAAQVAAARTKGLAGEFSALSSNAETLGIKIGQGLAPPVEKITGDLNVLIGVLNKFGEGDFGGGIADFLHHQKEEGKQELKGIGQLFTSIVHPGDLSKGLKNIFGGLEEKPTAVDNLLESLDALQKVRITAFSAGIPIGPITAQIKTVRDQLKAAKVDAGLLIPVTPLEKVKAPFQDAIRQAQEFKKALEARPDAGTPGIVAQIASLDKIIRAATPAMKAAVKKFRGEAEKEVTGLNLAKRFRDQFKFIGDNIKLATPEVVGSIDDMIAEIRKVPVGEAPRELGLKVVRNIQKAIDEAIAADDPELAAQLLEKAKKIATLFGISLQAAFKSIKIPLTSEDIAAMVLPEQIAGARAEAFGTITDQIAAKQAELADLKSHLPGGSALRTVKKGSQEEFDLLQQIIGVQGEIAGLQKDATDTSKADTAVLDAISAKEQALQNARALAQTTESLNDDLKAERALRAFYIKQVKVVEQTVKDKKERNDAIKDLKQKLFELDLDIAGTIADRAEKMFDDAAQAAEETVSLADDLRVAQRRVRFWEHQVKVLEDLVKKRKATAAQLQAAQDKLDDAEDEAKKALRARRQQRRENIQERLELKIQIAADNENVKAEIAAREAQIRNTKKLISQTRKGSLQRLRLIAELRREQRELRDLKKEKDKANQDAQAVIFAFLQAQQGFAANLLSNLVPFHVADNALGDAGARVPSTGGGGPRTGTRSVIEPGIDPRTGRPIRESGAVTFPGDALAREATVQAATKPQQGFTNTQVTRLLALQGQIVTLLGGKVKDTAHPQAKSQRARSGGSADVE